MNRNPITDKPPIDETPRAKSGKRKKRETSCIDKKRRYSGCHICGSEDIAYEVLAWCEVCGKETFNISTGKHLWRWEWDDIEKPCSCEEIHHPVYKYRMSPRHHISRKVCITCGSMKTDTCPNCHKSCWISPFGEKQCTSCGYRYPGYEKRGEIE